MTEQKASINLWDMFEQLKKTVDDDTVRCINALGKIVGDKNGAGCTARNLEDGAKAYKRFVTSLDLMGKIRRRLEPPPMPPEVQAPAGEMKVTVLPPADPPKKKPWWRRLCSSR